MGRSKSVFCKERLHSRRIELGYSLQTLADATHSSKSYIWELENKDTRRPSIDKVYDLAKNLGVSMEWLCGGDVTHDARMAAIGAKVYAAVMPHIDMDLFCDFHMRPAVDKLRDERDAYRQELDGMIAAFGDVKK